MNTLTRHKHAGISYLTAGNGAPFLLLHGIPGSSYTWECVGTQLSDHYRVIIPDLMGFGESDPPSGDYYMPDQAKALKRLLDTLAIDSLFVAGHDFGGPVALTMMRLFPELQVDGLVLSQTNVFTDTPIPLPLKAARLPVIATPVFWLMIGNLPSLYMTYIAAAYQKENLPWTEFRRHLTSHGIHLTRRIFQRSLSDLPGNYGEIQAFLSKIAIPTLVLWAANDPFFTVATGERVQRAIAESSLKVYDHTGHFVPEERSQQVSEDIVKYFSEYERRSVRVTFS